jgi:uncharacterized protein
MVRISCAILALLLVSVPVRGQEIPQLTQPVNDFANVIDPDSENQIDALIRSLQRASGDVIVVATVDTIAPYADIREYAVEMFENRGRGIGERGRDNGVLVLLAMKEREVRVEVGYELEQFITDGFAGETSRQVMAPEFRRGRYGPGLLAGVSRLATRIAQGRNVTLQGAPQTVGGDDTTVGIPGGLMLALFIAFIVINALVGRTRRHRRFTRRWGGPIGGWSSGVGPFGGGFGGFGGRGGGFGGGFGGFGGGRSGGGGGGAGW